MADDTRLRGPERLSISLKRNDFCLLIDALESIIEDFKWDGGLVLADEYVRMEARLKARLRSHDLRRSHAERETS